MSDAEENVGTSRRGVRVKSDTVVPEEVDAQWQRRANSQWEDVPLSVTGMGEAEYKAWVVAQEERRAQAAAEIHLQCHAHVSPKMCQHIT